MALRGEAVLFRGPVAVRHPAGAAPVKGEYPPGSIFCRRRKRRRWLPGGLSLQLFPADACAAVFYLFASGLGWGVSLHVFGSGVVCEPRCAARAVAAYLRHVRCFLLVLLKKVRDNPLATFLFWAWWCAVSVEYSTAWYLETFKHAKWVELQRLPSTCTGASVLRAFWCSAWRL